MSANVKQRPAGEFSMMKGAMFEDVAQTKLDTEEAQFRQAAHKAQWSETIAKQEGLMEAQMLAVQGNPKTRSYSEELAFGQAVVKLAGYDKLTRRPS